MGLNKHISFNTGDAATFRPVDPSKRDYSLDWLNTPSISNQRFINRAYISVGQNQSPQFNYRFELGETSIHAEINESGPDAHFLQFSVQTSDNVLIRGCQLFDLMIDRCQNTLYNGIVSKWIIGTNLDQFNNAFYVLIRDPKYLTETDWLELAMSTWTAKRCIDYGLSKVAYKSLEFSRLDNSFERVEIYFSPADRPCLGKMPPVRYVV